MKRVTLVLALAIGGCSESKPSGAGDAGRTTDAPAGPDVALPAASRIPDGARAVGFNEFFGDVPSCGQGWAHPNICCQASPDLAPACFASASPFLPCPASWLTYPDASRCCSLGGDDSCVAGTPHDGGVDGGQDAGQDAGEDAGQDGGQDAGLDSGVDANGDGGSDEACQEPCSPGSWLDGDGNCCWGRGTVIHCTVRDRCAGSIEACTAILGAKSTRCGACPEGWAVPAAGQAGLCCRSTPVAQCFSQAKSIPVARLGSGLFCVEPPGKGTCRCELTRVDWRLEATVCDKTASPVCTVTLDGVVTGTSDTYGCTPPGSL